MKNILLAVNMGKACRYVLSGVNMSEHGIPVVSVVVELVGAWRDLNLI